MRGSLLVCIAVILTAGAALAGPWYGPGGGGTRTGLADASLTPPLYLDWRFVTGDTTWTATSPAVTDSLVAFAVGKKVYGVDPTSGEKKWEYATNGVVNSQITIGDGVVLAGDQTGVLHGIEADTGKRRFQYRVTEEGRTEVPIESGFALVGDVVYFGDNAGTVHAVSAKTGTRIWPYSVRDRIVAAPTFYKDALYVATLTDVIAVQRLDAQGEQMWRVPVGRTGRYILGSPVVVDDRVIVAVGDEVMALSAGSGSIAWSQSAHATVVGSPAVSGSKVVFADLAGLVSCLDLANGREVWNTPTNLNARLPVDPEYAELRQSVQCSTIIAGDTVFVRTWDGLVTGVDLNSGAVKWEYKVEERQKPVTTAGYGAGGGRGGPGAGAGAMGPGGGPTGGVGGPGGGLAAGFGGQTNYLGVTTGVTLALDVTSGLAAYKDKLYVLGGTGTLYALSSKGVDSGPPIVKDAEVLVKMQDLRMSDTGWPVTVYDANDIPDRVISPSRMLYPSGELPSAGPIQLQARVLDLGTGIDPNSISVAVNGPMKTADFEFIEGRGVIQVYIPNRTTNQDLSDGDYDVLITAKDYAGHASTSRIHFKVNFQLQSPSRGGAMGGPGGGRMGPGGGPMGGAGGYGGGGA